MNTILQDFRFGLRMLARNPGFTTVAIMTLALGIGLNAAIFSIANAFLFRPLTVRHPEQIATFSVEERRGGFSNGFSYPDWQEIRSQTSAVFSDVSGARILGATGLSIGGDVLIRPIVNLRALPSPLLQKGWNGGFAQGCPVG